MGNAFSHWDFIPVPSSSPGFDITPNYVDASTTSITISPWCSCKGSGNMEEECEKFLRDFTENPCLRKALPCPAPFPAVLSFPSLPKPLPLPGNAIQAFGNGTDVNLAPKNPNPAVTALPKVEKSPALPDDVNDSNTAYDATVISTCTSPQVRPGPRLGALVGLGTSHGMGKNVLLGLIPGLEKSGCWLGSGMGKESRLCSPFPAETIP